MSSTAEKVMLNIYTWNITAICMSSMYLSYFPIPWSSTTLHDNGPTFPIGPLFWAVLLGTFPLSYFSKIPFALFRLGRNAARGTQMLTIRSISESHSDFRLNWPNRKVFFFHQNF